MLQNPSSNPAATRLSPDKHPFDLSTTMPHGSERSAPNRSALPPGEHEISARMLELGHINSIHGLSRIERPDFSVQCSDQILCFSVARADGKNLQSG